MAVENTLSFPYGNGAKVASSQKFDKFISSFDNSTYVFIVVDFEGQIKFTNSVLPTILGVNDNCFSNQTFEYVVQAFVHPDDINFSMQAFSEVIQGQCVNRLENRYWLQDGSYIWLSWMIIPFVQERVFYAIAHEITEQRGLENRLETSEIKIETIFNKVTDCIYALDEEWKFIYINISAALAFAQITDQNVLGKSYWDIFPGEDNRFYQKLKKASLTQKPVYFESTSILTGGWISVDVYPTPQGISVHFKDINEQKKLEKSLQDERKRLYAILDGLPGLVYLRKSEGNVIFANHTFKDIHGDPDNRKCFKILFDRNEPCCDCNIQLTTETEVPKQWQCVIKDTIYEVFQHPFQDPDGTQLFLMQMLDITKRKIAEEEITRLDRLNLVGELAASIAHEVRNPMTTVRGFLQILKSRDVVHENEEYFNLMISELDRANSIITEFLSIAKTKTELYKVVKLNNLVNSLYPLILADAINQEKHVILETHDVDELTMNEREIRQIVLNLTRNGLEAMFSMGILKIKTYREENSIVLAVQDQGTGISENILARLGTPFLTTKEHGTGLGLATCYSIAERHNAKIDVESNPSGTTFFVRFKLP